MFYVKVGDESVVYTGDYNMTPDRHLGSAWMDKTRPDLLITETTCVPFHIWLSNCSLFSSSLPPPLPPPPSLSLSHARSLSLPFESSQCCHHTALNVSGALHGNCS